MNGKFKNKIVLITGATSGIGKVAAIAFANEETIVLVVGRNENRAQDIVNLSNANASGKTVYRAILGQSIESENSQYDIAKTLFLHRSGGQRD